MKNLNQSIDSGLSLNRSLKLAAQKIPDTYFFSRYEDVYTAVERGDKLSLALALL